MNFKGMMKKSGFTLMEIVIALFIVAILVLITVPVINKQLEKSEEYSYYLAYKTVERMAGQIVALGDEEELADSSKIKYAEAEPTFGDYLSNKVKLSQKKFNKFFTNAADRFAKSEEFIFRRLFPDAFAGTVCETWEEEGMSWSETQYDDIWLAYHVCKGDDIPKTKTVTTSTDAEGNTVENVEYGYYTCSKDSGVSEPDIDCAGYTDSSSENGFTVSAHSVISSTLYSSVLCPTANASSLANIILGQGSDSINPETFCNSLKSYCNGTTKDGDITKKTTVTPSFSAPESSDDGEEIEDDEESAELGDDFVEAPTSIVWGTCKFITENKSCYEDIPTEYVEPDTPEFSADICDDMGYKNMTNAGATKTINCQPKSGYIVSENNDKMAVLPCASADASANADTNGGRVCCTTDFNPNAASPNGGSAKGACCPDNSVYNGGDTCTCIEGYDMNADGTQCIPNGKCTSGSTWDPTDKVCVVNPPITRASRLCEKIVEYWNVNSSYCNAFQTTNGVNYYKAVYEAAKGQGANSNRLMSVNSQVGAFGLDSSGNDKIRPNIVFANGLKLWILGDKAASIPGLSFTTDNASASQNMCRNLKKSTSLSCSTAGGYFCKSEKNCFTMDATSLSAGGGWDARTCCGSSDLSDIEAEDSVNYMKNTQAYAIAGFTVFVDINGDRGKGTLWDDVYPFFLGYDGTVYPGYPLDAPKSATDDSNSLYRGGNSSQQLTADVYYYEATDTSRERKVAFSAVSYARAICSARKISKYTPYCMNLGDKFYGGVGLEGDDYISDDDPDTSKNPCDQYKCFVSVRRKLKTF